MLLGVLYFIWQTCLRLSSSFPDLSCYLKFHIIRKKAERSLSTWRVMNLTGNCEVGHISKIRIFTAFGPNTCQEECKNMYYFFKSEIHYEKVDSFDSFISRTSSNKEVVINDQQSNGDMNPIQNFTTIPITQTLNYTLSRQGHLEKEPWNAFSHHSPVNVSMDGIPCILFWAKGITVKFKNQTWLDLTDEAFGQTAAVDISNSNCSEESAILSLKFGDAEIPKGLDIRFTLTNYNKLYLQSWFSLQRVEIIFNNSIQATFNATGIYAPSSYSYHCQRVSSLQRYDALLLPSYTDDMSSLWEVTFVDFQVCRCDSDTFSAAPSSVSEQCCWSPQDWRAEEVQDVFYFHLPLLHWRHCAMQTPDDSEFIWSMEMEGKKPLFTARIWGLYTQMPSGPST
ncbi:V-type proton ATPase subunit S1-like protein isoform X2 [Mirounga leonina]|uniref:V-type proton ATPase subunit S1-like protein isoform X2 n=1 Tax=Mirounga leonina TaxID=9715 RepID=UPI00156C5950|nr:V-type proton ATPase subunit S1-like protein isoform X2 [Mirounga leonina]